ncbi:serine hydrolase domain-containing protein [Streptomyces sp. PmtG]
MNVRTSLAGVATAVALAAGALAAPAAAAPATGAHDGHHDATERALNAAVHRLAPGATAQARDAHGTWNAAAGIGDLDKRTPRGTHDHFRAASITKTFTATVALQLEAEGRLDLDDTVGRWLPGLVEGNGYDGDRITLRQLLNHTSGIFEVAEDEDFLKRVAGRAFLKHRYDTWTPQELIGIALRHKPYAAPGEVFHYSNTNYGILQLVIEKATGRGYGDEIRRRVIGPLKLRHTYVPHTRPTMPKPSSRAYMLFVDESDEKLHDATEFNPSLFGAAGSMISTSADLNRFYGALLGGRLLPAEQLAEMKKTVGKGDEARMRYGLGLESLKLSCTTVWGHLGDIHGSTSLAMASEDGRHALAVNFNGPDADRDSVAEAEFCGA